MEIVTGGAGFIAQTLIRRLLEEGQDVLALDNLVRGSLDYLKPFEAHPAFAFRNVDCSDKAALSDAVRSIDLGPGPHHIWHLAANSDIGAGNADMTIDLRDTFLTTVASVELAQAIGAARFHFASTSAIYGDHQGRGLAEDDGPLEPISNYGAMKLASEATIRAAVERFLPKADIFRFPNVVGLPATHGAMMDFVLKLKRDPSRLDVLGDGRQQKPYLHVTELVDAMLFISRTAQDRYNVFNIGPKDDGALVSFMAKTVRDIVSPGADIVFGEGDRGWVGDVPRVSFKIDRLTGLGWTPTMSSEQAVVRAAGEIASALGAA